MKNIEELPRDNRGGYCVPDSYFSELSHKLVEQTQQPAHGGFWTTFRSMTAFVGGFAALAIIAATGYFLTGHQAQQTELNDDNYMMMSLYDITTEDIIESQNVETQTSTAQFTEAAIVYLDIQGYDLIEITE